MEQNKEKIKGNCFDGVSWDEQRKLWRVQDPRSSVRAFFDNENAAALYFDLFVRENSSIKRGANNMDRFPAKERENFMRAMLWRCLVFAGDAVVNEQVVVREITKGRL